MEGSTRAIMALLSMGNYITINKTLMRELGILTSIYFAVLVDKNRYALDSNRLIKNKWFYAKQEEIAEKYLLSVYQQGKSAKELVDLGLLEIDRMGQPGKNVYFIVYDKVINLLNAKNGKVSKKLEHQTLMRQESRPACGKSLDSKETRDYIYKNKYNNNRENNSCAEKNSAQKEKKEKNSKIQKTARSHFRLSAVAEKVSRVEPPLGLTEPEHIAVFNSYKKIYPMAKKTTKSLIEGIPRALKIFKGYYPGEEVDKLCFALSMLAEDEWWSEKSAEKVFIVAPKNMFSHKRIEDTLVPFAITNPKKDGTLCIPPQTDEELREIQETGKRKADEFLANARKKRDT